MIKFGCVSCGHCCRGIKNAFENIDKMPPFEADALKQFPYAVKTDGSCEKLVDGKCSVYEKRPLICNMDKMYNTYYRKANIPQREFFNLSARACNALIEANGGTERVKMI